MQYTGFFRYQTGSSFLHRLHPVIKIILLFTLALSSFALPVKWALCAWAFFICFAIFLRFSPVDILNDLFPAFLYALMVYGASILSNVLTHSADQSLIPLFYFNMQYLPLLVHLSLSLEITSIFYRTTSSLEFHQGFSQIEQFFTRKKESPWADSLSLTLTFVPEIVHNWQKIELAWKSRGGKNNIRKIITLVPLLFRVSFHSAYQKALALENRR